MREMSGASGGDAALRIAASSLESHASLVVAIDRVDEAS
jgi:hypothetical protein